MTDPVRASDMRVGRSDLERLADRFDLRELEHVGGFENVVLRSTGEPGRIVRLTHTSRRSQALVEAEVAFMRHLARADVSVVAPIPSKGGDLVEAFVLEDGTPTVAYCMTEAPGRIKAPGDWSDDEIVALGELLARAHVAAESFDPSGGPRRPLWTDPVFDPGTSLLGDPEFVEAWQWTRDHAAAHPAGGTHLLIHQDAHFWNLHIDESVGLTLFDFDDCGYGTPEHDVGIVLFYWLFAGWSDPVAAARRLLQRLLEGYSRHAELIDEWPDGVDRILKVREADIYLLIALQGDASAFEERWMEGRRARVLDAVPLLGSPLADLI